MKPVDGQKFPVQNEPGEHHVLLQPEANGAKGQQVEPPRDIALALRGVTPQGADENQAKGRANKNNYR